MSNKFLNPSGETDLSDVIARVNGNTEAIQDHVGDLANPHTTSTDNIQGNNSPPLNSDDIQEGATNKFLVQPFVGNFDMGGNQIINATAVGNPAGQIVVAGSSTAVIIDPSPTLGILAQTGANQDINLISSADFDIKNLNVNDNIRLFGDGIQLKDQAGTNYLTLDATEITSFKDINMNTNDITNANVLVRASNGNIIDFDAGGGLELQSGVGNNIEIKAGSDTAQITGGNAILSATGVAGVQGGTASIGETTSNMSLLFQSNAASIQQGLTNIAAFTPTLNSSFQDLDMNLNELKNVQDIRMPDDGSAELFNVFRINGSSVNSLFMTGNAISATANNLDVNFRCLNPSTCIRFRVGASGSVDKMFVCNTEVKSFVPLNMDNNDIENAGDVALTSINTNVIYVPDGTMPTSFVADRTYIFLGSRSTATPIVLPAGSVTLKGESRENSTIEYTGTGALFTSTDQNLSISDLGWSCTNTGGYFLDATNATKDKLLTIQNCEFREAYQVMKITGYDLVDFQNNVLTYIRAGATLTNYGVDCIDVSKLEINSCEFIRWYEVGQPVNTNSFVGNMISISGTNGASQLTNNIIHPRVAQNGIDIDAAATFAAGVNITGNTFVDAGLTTGVILETNSNTDYDEKGITEANTLLPNLKARVGAQLSAANTITTATSGTPADINLNNLLVAFDEFGVTVGAGGGVTYNRTRPVNFQVTFVANLQAITGGANQRVGLTVSKNGVNTGINSFVNLDSAGTEPKSVTLTIVGSAVQGDVFRSQLVNTSTSSNITCTDLIVSGIEI